MLHNYKIFSSLIGEWQLSRTIHQNNQVLPTKGTAIFTRLDDCNALYQEQCTLTMPESELEMTREYFYIYNKAENQIEKYFSQDSQRTYLFYIIDQELQGSHLCVKDTYHAKYLFPESDNFNEFALIYKVGGPTKNYTSTTTYTKKI